MACCSCMAAVWMSAGAAVSRTKPFGTSHPPSRPDPFAYLHRSEGSCRRACAGTCAGRLAGREPDDLVQCGLRRDRAHLDELLERLVGEVAAGVVGAALVDDDVLGLDLDSVTEG